MQDSAEGSLEPSYPVVVDVDPQMTDRNRLTVAFRIILAIPHLILVGAVGFTFGGSSGVGADDDRWWLDLGGLGSGGLLGIAVFFVAVIAWFALVFTRSHPRGLWKFAEYYLRWRSRSSAYYMLLRDDYPPFGDGEYPTTYGVEYPEGRRAFFSVLLRIIYVIPHIIVLVFLSIAWFVTAVIAWFAILFTGKYPAGLYRFAVGYLRWELRVETYALLMRDEYPPFSLDP